ncbi:MAG TPA: hypothetical protein VEX35_04975 [Allosphingosinicella sp.]|nr:hypothetical protein [Allosphingosinicella sp.]
MQAISEYDLTQSGAWTDLDALSTHTYLDDVEVDPEGIVLDDGLFKGFLNIYVLLQYGSGKKEGFQTSDAFRGRFTGHFDGTVAVIDEVSVDTSPFYAGETG